MKIFFVEHVFHVLWIKLCMLTYTLEQGYTKKLCKRQAKLIQKSINIKPAALARAFWVLRGDYNEHM